MSERNTNPLLSGQPQCDGEAVFDAPWQAKTFAMTIQLHQKGVFEWQEWVDRLSTNIKAFEAKRDVTNSDDYYGVWLQTLEEFMSENLSKL
ncbi:MAG: nitrile hydratase accessory protein [Gammaproteobacteria bacterium]|nr:nitrile hydratase accessory protein [Gammaproteobacteria bacterium]